MVGRPNLQFQTLNYMIKRLHQLNRHFSTPAKMSTFTLPNTEATVSLASDLTKEELLSFPAFKVNHTLTITIVH